MNTLTIMKVAPAAHVQFWIFNLVWPNIIFWLLVPLVFYLAARARIPEFMEADLETRNREEMK